MLFGVFSPAINWCGGAEWVAINIVNSLKDAGYQVIVLTDERLNQNKFLKIFNRKVAADQQFVLPLRFFSAIDNHNIYTDIIRSLTFKLKCDVLIDTYSNALLPGVEVSYIHHPFFKLLAPQLSQLRNRIYYYPYRRFCDFSKKANSSRLLLANSRFTADAVKSEFNVDSKILYPPVSKMLDDDTDLTKKRNNSVVTISRISQGKNLGIIPYIAQKTRADILFTIAGILDSEEVLKWLLGLIRKLKVSDKVKILTNVRRGHLSKLLLDSKVYLHSMINEHFGVSIVEAMALGCIPIVHDSGGPREFVAKQFRYSDLDEAAMKVERALDDWSPARAISFSKDANRFSEENFSRRFIDILKSHFP